MGTTKTKPREFTQKNKYIFPGFLDELIQVMKFARLKDILDFLKILNRSNLKATTNYGQEVTLLDLVALHGDFEYADSVTGLWFYAGPCQKNTNFELVQGTALDLFLDVLLYDISINGYGVLKKLNIPL
jgi:hypothetical protein